MAAAGPGSGPVVLSERLAPYAPVPFVRMKTGKAELVEAKAKAAKGEKPFVA